MPKIIWSEAFSVDNKEIDEQHKKWIEITNELHDILIHSNLQKHPEITKQTIKAMRDYVRFHFSFEEDYLLKIGYPNLSAHKRKHDKFYVRVKELYSDEEEGKLVLNSEVMTKLISWLQGHILFEDKKYSQFVSEQK